MLDFKAYLFLTLVMAVPGMLNLLMLRLALKRWWQRRSIRALLVGLAIVGTISPVLWYGLLRYADPLVAENFCSFMVTVFWIQIALLVAFCFSAVLLLVNWLFDRRSGRSLLRSSASNTSRSRRFFLRGAAATLPIISAATTAAGVASSFYPARVYRRVFNFNNLPAALAGLRILHLSDLHLWDLMTTHDLQVVLDQAKVHTPDLVVITGDFVDDPRLFPEALTAVNDFGAPLGVLATLGNHEHALQRNEVFRHFSDSPVRLLVNQGVELKIGRESLYIGGVDDPNGRTAGISFQEHFQHGVGVTLANCPPNAFRILLSHRPDVLDYVDGHGVSLILAGHTHGGQIGLAGHSILEVVGSQKYPWGLYQRGTTQLYTSSGTGQWFPFRLGCRPEAVIIELQPA